MKVKNESFLLRYRFAPQNRHLLFLFVLICVNSLLHSTTWHIKQDGTGNFTTIQEGINASADSDTVLVYPGTYYENLDMTGKNITLTSLEMTTGDPQYIASTIIDGQRQESCIILQNINIDVTIRGFTIQNGYGTFSGAYDGGGIYAIYIENGTIMNCHLRNNLATYHSAKCPLRLLGIISKEEKTENEFSLPSISSYRP